MFKEISFLMTILFFNVLSIAAPNMRVSYREGTRLGDTLSTVSASEASLKEAINFKTNEPKETKHYGEQANISQAAVNSLEEARTSFERESKESAGSILIEIESQRENISLDSENDPLFKQSDAIMANSIIRDPDQILSSEQFTVSEQTEDTEVVCEESRPKEEFTCTKELIQARSTQKEKRYSHTRIHGDSIGNTHVPRFDRTEYLNPPPPEKQRRWTDGCNWFYDYVENTYKFFRRVVAIGVKGFRTDEWREITKEEYDAPTPSLPDEWADNCSALKVNAGAWGCQKVKEECLEGPLTKKVGDISFARACWKQKETYACGVEKRNSCDLHRARGCYDISSRCILTHQGKCQAWEKRLKCPGRGNIRTVPAGKGIPFCHAGDCVSTDYEPNKDLTEVMTKLSLLKEMKGQGEDFQKGKIFEGKGSKCSKHCLNFSDCCTISGGWGEGFGLTRCSEGEKLLAKDRVAGKCHKVGTYCAEKNLGVCTLKKTSYCCYGSKLARILHEQGRAQLGLGWGSSESPLCRALTLDEFKQINFELINFSEAFEDVSDQIKKPTLTKTIENFRKNWEKRLPRQKSDVSSSQMHKQVEERVFSLKTADRGSYSLNGSPPKRDHKEEPEVQVVF